MGLVASAQIYSIWYWLTQCFPIFIQDERVGQGIGTQSGPYLFLDLETVIPETDFDENPAEAATGKKIMDKKTGENELGNEGHSLDVCVFSCWLQK